MIRYKMWIVGLSRKIFAEQSKRSQVWCCGGSQVVWGATWYTMTRWHDDTMTPSQGGIRIPTGEHCYNTSTSYHTTPDIHCSQTDALLVELLLADTWSPPACAWSSSFAGSWFGLCCVLMIHLKFFRSMFSGFAPLQRCYSWPALINQFMINVVRRDVYLFVIHSACSNSMYNNCVHLFAHHAS